MADANSLGCYSETTRDICVTILPEFVDERSAPEDGVFVYVYTVTLENTRPEVVQLINRHWIVNAAGRKCADIKGEGVGGEKPVLEPGVAYQYASWIVLNEPAGSICGNYTFRSEGGEFFDVAIPNCSLLYIDPEIVH